MKPRIQKRNGLWICESVVFGNATFGSGYTATAAYRSQEARAAYVAKIAGDPNAVAQHLHNTTH